MSSNLPEDSQLEDDSINTIKELEQKIQTLEISFENLEEQRNGLELKLSELSDQYAMFSELYEECRNNSAHIINLKERVDTIALEIKERNTSTQKIYEENKAIQEKMKLDASGILNLYNSIFIEQQRVAQLEVDQYRYEELNTDERSYNTDDDMIHFYEITKTPIPSIETSIKEKKQEFEAVIKNSNDQLAKQLDNLTEKINNLLPGATTAGLATSYEDSKKMHLEEKGKWQNIFISAMILMVVFAAFLLYNKILTIEIKTFSDTLVRSIQLLTLESPLIWLALLANRKINQHNRLYEEYLHKWAMARSFEGMKKEFMEIDNSNTGDKHIDKLAQSFIDAVALNPSNTLGKSSTDTPLDNIKNCFTQKNKKKQAEPQTAVLESDN